MTLDKNVVKIENREVEARIYNIQGWVNVVDPEVLKRDFEALLNVSGFHVLNFMEHHFPNGGYTSIWLLAESHLAIHSFVAEGRSYIELSGCNKAMTDVFAEEFDKIKIDE